MASQGWSLDLDNEEDPVVYTYEPLPSQNSIRLLRLSDASLRFEGFVFQRLCTLETFTLESLPPYLTLSYTWGAPLLGQKHTEEYAPPNGWLLASSEPCIEQGQCVDFPSFARVSIGKNLWFCLRRLSLKPPETRYIWIDAICIDQSNLEERASQVSMMTEIYARCTSSIIWLGDFVESGADLGKFYNLHVEVDDAIGAFYEEHEPGNIGDDWSMSDFYTRLKLENLQNERDWKGYAQFFEERSWFTRAWVRQEIYFTPDAVFMFANLLPDLDLLFRVAHFLRVTGLNSQLAESIEWEEANSDSEEAPESSESSVIKTTPAGWLMNMDNMRRTTKGVGTQLWLEKVAGTTNSGSLKIAAYTFWAYVLAETRHSKATDKRDKVFATHGFLQVALKPLGMIPDHRTMPDYTKSPAQTYEDTMRVLLTETANFSMLSEVQDPSFTLLRGLPSWVPDFSDTLHQSLFRKDRYDFFNASACTLPCERPTSVRFTPFPDALMILQGSLVGVVKTTPVPSFRDIFLRGKSLPTSTTLFQFRKGEMLRWRLLLDQVTAYDPVSTWKALFHTLLAGRPVDTGQLPVNSRHFKAYITEYMGAVHRHPKSHETQEDNEMQNILTDANDADQEFLPTDQEVLTFITSYDYSLKHQGHMTEADLAFVKSTTLEARRFEKNMCEYGRSRRLFATHEGYLGLGPLSMQDGDEVWLVREARMLFTVRPLASGEYQLIGETYMYGCMNGELVGQAEEKRWVHLKLR